MYRVIGRTVTPVVARDRWIGHDYGLVVLDGVQRFWGKVKRGVKMYPSAYKAFYGTVEYYTDQLDKVLALDAIGRFQSEGAGMVRWFRVDENAKPPAPRKRVKIARCLPKLSNERERLVRAMLLHDFVSNTKHQSKIYFDVEIEDDRIRWLCEKHHEDVDDPELETLQKYDRWAATIQRNIRFKTFSRYNLSAKSKIDFEALKEEIELRQHSAYALYSFVYNSKELEAIAEDMDYGFSSLRRHLLTTVNLYILYSIIQDDGRQTNRGKSK